MREFNVKILIIVFLSLFPTVSFGQITKEVFDSLLTVMSRYEIVCGRYMGSGASTTESFKAFERFVNETDSEQKLMLLREKNPVLRTYAFWGLTLTDTLLAKKEFETLFRKKQKVKNCLYGCICGINTYRELASIFLFDPFLFYKKRE